MQEWKLGCRVLRKDLRKSNPTHIASSLFSWFTDKKKGDEEVDEWGRSNTFLHFKKDKEVLIMSEYEKPEKMEG